MCRLSDNVTSRPRLRPASPPLFSDDMSFRCRRAWMGGSSLYSVLISSDVSNATGISGGTRPQSSPPTRARSIKKLRMRDSNFGGDAKKTNVRKRARLRGDLSACSLLPSLLISVISSRQPAKALTTLFVFRRLFCPQCFGFGEPHFTVFLQTYPALLKVSFEKKYSWARF